MSKNWATVYAITTIYSAASEFKDKVPYTTAILESADGGRFLAFIEGSEGTATMIGETVEFLSQNEDGNPIYAPVRKAPQS